MVERDKTSRVKRLLWQWGQADRQCAELLEELRRNKELIDDARMTLRATNADGMPHASTPGDPTANAVMAIDGIIASFVECAEYTQDKITQINAMRRAIDDQVAALTPHEREVIQMRYKRGYSAVYISIKLECSERTVYNYEESAIEKISANCSFLQEN